MVSEGAGLDRGRSTVAAAKHAVVAFEAGVLGECHIAPADAEGFARRRRCRCEEPCQGWEAGNEGTRCE